jgi:ubiquinone/menaquinone biosynthesis C-methylase UbiE
MHVTQAGRGLPARLERSFWTLARRIWHGVGPAGALRGFGAFQALVAGSRLGLFDLLARRADMSLEEIRQETGLPAHSVDALLLATTSLGLTRLNRRTRRYRNGRLMRRFLATEQRGNAFPTLDAFHELLYPAFQWTTESLRSGTNEGLRVIPGGEPTLYERLEHDPRRKRVFHAWMDSMGSGRSKIPAAVLTALSDRGNVLDVGGGDGENAIALARRFREIRVTIFDLPLACELARESAGRAGLAHRVQATPGDFLTQDLPTGFDAIVIAHIFNIYSSEANAKLVRRCFAALPDGGRLIVYNLVSSDDQSGPWHAGFMSLYFQVLATGNGMVYPPSAYEPWFCDAGFRSLRVRVEPKSGEGVFVGVK